MCGKEEMNTVENDIQIAVTGTPRGLSSFGDRAAQAYSENLYNSIYTDENSNYLCCEIREENGRICFYYSFIVPKTNDCEGRAGGFFAITLRAGERYCEDLSRLYQLLLKRYERFAVGILIDESKHFLVPDLQNPHSEELITKLRNSLNNYFSKSFTPWDKGHIKPKNETILRCHISEMGCDLFFDDFCNHGTAFLSPSFLRADERARDLNRQLQETKNLLQQTKSDLQNAKVKNTELKTKISELETEKEQSKHKNGRLEKTDKLPDSINPKMDELITSNKELAEGFQTYSHRNIPASQAKKAKNPANDKIEKGKHSALRNKRLILIVLLTVLIVIGGGVFLFKKCSSKDSDKGNRQEETQTSVVTKTVEKWKIPLEASKGRTDYKTKLNGNDTITFIAPDDVEVEKWIMDGFEELSQRQNRCTVKVTAQTDSSAVISFVTDKKKKYKHWFTVK